MYDVRVCAMCDVRCALLLGFVYFRGGIDDINKAAALPNYTAMPPNQQPPQKEKKVNLDRQKDESLIQEVKKKPIQVAYTVGCCQ